MDPHRWRWRARVADCSLVSEKDRRGGLRTSRSLLWPTLSTPVVFVQPGITRKKVQPVLVHFSRVTWTIPEMRSRQSGLFVYRTRFDAWFR